jgi:hypothetical protein
MPTSVILLNIKELSFWVAASAKREALCLCLEENSGVCCTKASSIIASGVFFFSVNNMSLVH